MAAARDEIGRLMRVHDVYRGQVLSFTESEHHGNGLVSFLPRPAVTAPDVVLPGDVLESIEQHIIGVAGWSRELLDAGTYDSLTDGLDYAELNALMGRSG